MRLVGGDCIGDFNGDYIGEINGEIIGDFNRDFTRSDRSVTKPSGSIANVDKAEQFQSRARMCVSV